MKKKHKATRDSLLALVSADMFLLQRAGLSETQAAEQLRKKLELGFDLLEKERASACSCGKETDASSWN